MSGKAERIVLFAGGVGGARLALPLFKLLRPQDILTVIVNVGDDFEHMGLYISPDLDTVLYHLAGQSDDIRDWGLANDSYTVMNSLERLGGLTWFQLGDKDLATHMYRTGRMNEGIPLSAVTAELVRALQLPNQVHLLPVTDQKLRTFVLTDGGTLPFQTYLVKRRAQDKVNGFIYDGSDTACPAPGVISAL